MYSFNSTLFSALVYRVCLLLVLSITTVQAAPRLHHTESMELEQQQGYQIQRRFTGSVFAHQDVMLGFELAGKLQDVYVNTGDKVSAGQLLAQLDTELLETEQKELLAQQAQTEADIVLVRANLKRLSSLKKKGYTSEQSVDELKARQTSLQANKTRILASLNANQLRIKKSSLLAPFDASIGQRIAATGLVVGAGDPVFQLLQQQQMEIKVGIPMRLLPGLEPGSATHAIIAGKRYQIGRASCRERVYAPV